MEQSNELKETKKKNEFFLEKKLQLLNVEEKKQMALMLCEFVEQFMIETFLIQRRSCTAHFQAKI